MIEERVFETVSTKDGYDRWAEIYDSEDNPLIAIETPRVWELLGDVRGLDVLDLGCGTGRWAAPLAAGGAAVTAVDFSAGMLARAKEKAGWDRVRFIAHDLGKGLPFDAGAFDRVLCCLVLDHVAELAPLFREMGRVLRVGGGIVISVMHPAMMLRGVQAHFRDPRSGCEIRPASAPNQISNYVMAAIRAGLCVEHISEHAVDEVLAARSPRAAKYRHWPMLLMMLLRPSP